MLKWLVLLLVVVGALWWIRQSARGGRGDARPEAEAPATRKDTPPEAMIACAHCGAWVPESEAVVADGHRYCSADHRNAGPRRSA